MLAAKHSTAEFRLATQRVRPDVWLVSLSGECGEAAGADLGRWLASLHVGGRPTQAVVDLSAATEIRSGLFHHLVEGARAARKEGVSVTFVTEDSSLRRALGEAEREGSLKLERALAVGIRDALIASLP